MGNKRILLVEDDDKLRSTVQDYMQMNGFQVTACADGSSALRSFENDPQYDIILLDGLLPDIDGFDVMAKIRKVSNIPIIIVSARESEESQLAGLKGGADNYITKPFLLSVMKEKVNALLHRASGEPADRSRELVSGHIRIITDSRKVYIDDSLLETTPREYDLLLYFVRNSKLVLSRDMILDKVWGIDYFGDFRTVDTIVKQLRKKLGKYSCYISSVYGVGYCYEVDENA